MIDTILWVLTLPWFLAVYIGATLFEGLLWLIEAPGSAWALIKETLGL